jgi:hypothetical protein
VSKLLTLFVLFNFIAGCGSSSNDSKPSTTNTADSTTNNNEDLGYNPFERWTEKGDYSYNLDYTFNGANCKTSKAFQAKAEYCLGLQNQALNSDCALPLRQNIYKNECGQDFQEINFKNDFWKSGFDTHLQKRCETAQPQSDLFSTNKQYCEFLKDEVLHKSCFWSARLDKFQSRKCSEAFSQEPPLVPPSVSPQPTEPPVVTNPPVQQPDPLDEIAIVQELKAQGIEVNVDWQSIQQFSSHPLPGDLPLNEQMKILWRELESNKLNLLTRKDRINHIEVTVYTNYRQYKDDRFLYLDYETKPGQFAEYFSLFDQILRYSDQLKIDFDMIHSGYKRDSASYLPLRQMLSALEKNIISLRAMKGTFKSIKTNSYSAYFSNSQVLTLQRDKIEDELLRFINLLKPIAPVLVWAEKNAVEIKTEFDITKETKKIYEAFNVIQKAIPSLDQMIQAQMLNEIHLWFITSDQSYSSRQKSLTLALDEFNQLQVAKILKTLGQQALRSLEIQRPIELSLTNLDENYLKSYANLEAVWVKVIGKSASIKKITLGYASAYYQSLQELTIGYQTTLSDTEKLIATIK